MKVRGRDSMVGGQFDRGGKRAHDDDDDDGEEEVDEHRPVPAPASKWYTFMHYFNSFVCTQPHKNTHGGT